NRRVDLHSEHPRQPQKGPAYPVDGFYAARTSTITGAPLVGFVTALHRSARDIVREIRAWIIAELWAEIEAIDTLHPALALKHAASS
ncbi:MAG: hypothetical protein Q8S28_01650, partial [Hydrogenophaga sp.]|nr:hypothetical protein [Hydrogenophaga sp.]